MRQIFIILCMALFSTGAMMAQVGLEGVTIETYYVANATDIAYNDPGTVSPLPAGAVTYRMYVDMAPGWELQAVFGATNVGTGEVDTLVFRTTGTFWNHTDRGELYGYNIQQGRLDDNTVALDSWFSTGRTSDGTAGVKESLPTEDTDGQTPTHPHTPANMLLNNDPLAGLALTSEDGNIPSASTIVWSPTPGLETILGAVFNKVISPAHQVVISDGALGVTTSLVGPSGSNRVCIGQFTTGGIFSGQINLQIRQIIGGAVETYVAATPGPGQFTHSSLTWGPNALPTVDITAPADGTTFPAGSMINIAADADDTDGSVTQVEFFVGGVSIGIDMSEPYTASFTAGLVTINNLLIEAVATDNDGGQTTDAIHINILGNNPPVVDLTAPLTAITGTTVNISATATDGDGITQVEFFFNGGSIGVDMAPPYEASFTATPPGVRLIQAVATDGLGAHGTDSQNITIANNQAPTVSITAPAAGSYVAEGAVPVTASAMDGDGTVTQVEFFANGMSIGVDNTPPTFSVSWNAVFVGPFGDVDLTAVATDNLLLTGNSAIVGVHVINPFGAPYVVESVSQVCNLPTVCVPITVVSAIDDVIGFDMVLTWDNTKVFPTGNITRGNDLLNANFFETDNSIDLVNHKMLVSVFLDVDAPTGSNFSGTGDLICIEFAKRSSFQPVDSAIIELTSIQESYFDRVVGLDSIAPGEFTTYRNTMMNANIVFWEDDSPIYYNGSNLVTTIQANNSIDCSLNSAASPAALVGPVVNPDASGFFNYDLNNGVKFSIGKDIASTTDVLEVINGFDALLTRRTLVEDASFSPNVFQMIAMDVNRDGVVSSGDVSQINQRAVFFIPEFKQAWNYNTDGTPKPTYSPSKDWQFVDRSTVLFNPEYQISSSFPQDNGVGFSKHRVPKVPFCVTGPVSHFATCPIIGEETYIGVLYGDINGNYKNTLNLLLRSDHSVNIGVGQATYSDEFIDVPVTFESADDVNSIDLKLDFDGHKLMYHSLISGGMQTMGYYNENDGKLRITSNSLDVLTEGQIALVIRFTRLTKDQVHAEDFKSAIGYLNGEEVNVNLVESGTYTSNNNVNFNVTPNPTNDFIYINVSKDVTAEIIDLNGRVLMSGIQVAANSKQSLDVSHLSNGIYIVRVFGDDYTSTQRIYVEK